MDTTTPAPSAPPIAAASEDKTVAILAYITLIGFIVAIIIHMNKKTQLGAYHLRQMLGFIITGFVAGICIAVLAVIPILGWLCILAIWISLLVFWVMGLIAAINGQMKPMPMIGAMYQKWFANTFN